MEIHQGLEYLDVAVGYVNYFGRVVVGLVMVAAMIYFLTICIASRLGVLETEERQDIYLRLSEKNVERIQASVNGPNLLINQRQCLDLSSKLSSAFQNIQQLVSQCDLSTGLFKLSFQNLHRILEMAESLVGDCGRKDWITAAAFQIQNENAFRVILLEVGLCYDAIYQQARAIVGEEWNPHLEDLRNSPTFQPASTAFVDEDHDVTQQRLEDLIKQPRSSRLSARLYHFVLERASQKLRLAQQLLLKLECVPKRSHPVSDDCLLPPSIIWTEDSYPFMTWTREVSLGASGAGVGGVSKTSWLGIPCAQKYIDIIFEHLFSKEAGILCHVNHPNIVKFVCCGNEKKDGEIHHFIATELMEMSLDKLVEEQAEPLSYLSHHVAVDIMAQIARGVCYLHGRRVAHRDLKPHNVVLNGLTSSHNEGNYHVKVVDFGISKTQVDPERTMSTFGRVGTTRYVAPEVCELIEGRDGNAKKYRGIWFKADAWSFAVTCLEIFSLKHVDVIVDRRIQDVRSLLPERSPDELVPDELVQLLQQCLQRRARDRPDFLEICTRLEKLRHNLLRGDLAGSANHEFIETVIREHFENENAERILDDGEESLDMPIPSDLEEGGSSLARSRSGNEACNGRSPDWIDQPGNEQFKKARDDWLAEGAMYAERAQRSRQRSKASGVDIVTVIGWYIASNEFLFWAVAESGFLKFKCRYWWPAFSLSVLTTLFTVPVVIGRFRSVLSLEEEHSSCQHKSMVYSDRAKILLIKRERFSFTLDVVDRIKPPPKLTTLWVFSVLVLLSCLLRWGVKSVSAYEVLCHSDKSMIVWTLNVLLVSSLSVGLGLLVVSSYSVRGSLIMRNLQSTFKSWKSDFMKVRRWFRKRIAEWLHFTWIPVDPRSFSSFSFFLLLLASLLVALVILLYSDERDSLIVGMLPFVEYDAAFWWYNVL